MVFMLGPKVSRPFTQSLHMFVGVGFIFSAFLVQPFLPESNEGEFNICLNENNETNTTILADNSTLPLDMISGIPSINWPYVIIAAWHFFTAIGFILLAALQLEIPHYVCSIPRYKDQPIVSTVRYWGYILFLVFLYYAFSCGLEGFFMSMVYTFGICGPLNLTPGEAALLNTLYYAGFLFGRGCGVVKSYFIQPTKIITASLTGCLISAIVLSLVSTYSTVGLYIAVAFMGFFIAFQFPSGISWTAKRIDMTGMPMVIPFLGANAGNFIFPPLAGAIFQTFLGPIGIMYLTLVCVILHCCIFAAMEWMAKYKYLDLDPKVDEKPCDGLFSKQEL